MSRTVRRTLFSALIAYHASLSLCGGRACTVLRVWLTTRVGEVSKSDRSDYPVLPQSDLEARLPLSAIFLLKANCRSNSFLLPYRYVSANGICRSTDFRIGSRCHIPSPRTPRDHFRAFLLGLTVDGTRAAYCHFVRRLESQVRIRGQASRRGPPDRAELGVPQPKATGVTSSSNIAHRSRSVVSTGRPINK